MTDDITQYRALRHTWFPVALSTDLDAAPSGILARTSCGQAMAVFRGVDGAVTAVPDQCPHRQAPLSAGQLLDGCLECPYHGWQFASDGQCVTIPSAGPDATIPPAAHLDPFHCVERYGLIWVALAEPWADIAVVPWDDDPAFRRLHLPEEVWQSAATRMVDNFLDIAHFPWVHVETFGSATDRVVAPFDLVDLPDGYHGYAYDVTAANDGDGQVASGQDGDVVHRSMSTGFHLPCTVRSTIAYDTGLEHLIHLFMTPVDATTTAFFAVFWRNDDHRLPAEEVLVFDAAIAVEDRRLLEQIDGPLPLGRSSLVSVRSDRPSVEWRRRLVAWLEAGEER